jgi:hypothetical protein
MKISKGYFDPRMSKFPVICNKVGSKLPVEVFIETPEGFLSVFLTSRSF